MNQTKYILKKKPEICLVFDEFEYTREPSCIKRSYLTAFHYGTLSCSWIVSQFKSAPKTPELPRQLIDFHNDAMQRRIIRMAVNNKPKIAGRYKLKSKSYQKKYDDRLGDDDFIKDSGVDQTRTEQYVEDDLILEDYYLDLAIQAGKQTNSKPRQK